MDMYNEEQFKHKLQGKLSEKVFHFDEREWEKAAAIIDQNKQGGKYRFIYYLSGVLLLTFAYMGFNLYSTEKTTNVITQKRIQNKEIKNTPQLLSNNPPSANNNSDKPKQLIQTEPAKVESNKTAKRFEEKNKNENSDSHVTRSFASLVTLTTAASVDQNHSVPNDNADAENFSDKNQIVSAPLNNQNTISAASSDETKQILSPGIATETNQVSTLLSSKTNNSESENGAPAIQPLKDTAQLNVSNSETLSTLPDAKKDSTMNLALNKKAITNYLNFEAGFSYMLGWKNNDGKDADGFNAVVGVNYLSNVHSNYWFGLGIQYNRVGHLESSTKTSKITRYKLGEESQVTSITPNSLHYISAPFKLHYNLNDKNSLGINYTINYLLNVECTVEEYTENILGQSNYSSYTASGYTKGFQLFTSQIGFCYRRQVYKELWLNADFIFGLNDIKENSFFGTNTVERNSGLKLTLTYNLFKH